MNAQTKSNYKLMIMYMLSRGKFPLSNVAVSGFMSSANYCSYMEVQELITELISDGDIIADTSGSVATYTLSDTGNDTLKYFGNNISRQAREDIRKYLFDNSYELRQDNNTEARVIHNNSNDYTVKCTVSENGITLIGVEFSVPDEESANRMAGAWKTRSNDIYNYIMDKLSE